MANAFGSMENPSDTPEGIPLANADALLEDMPKEMLRLFKEAEKYVNRISKEWKAAVKEGKSLAGDLSKNQPGSGKLGLASTSTSTKVLMGTAIAGSLAMRMAPDTMNAVTQRIAADSFAGLSGMSSRQAILGANRLVGGGATSAMGPTMATMNLFYQGGYTASSLSSKNIMGQIAGMSAMSGMSNEAAAASVAGMNGMNFLRMGVSIRDKNGNLKPTDQIINDVYRFLYGGQKITKEQAALVYNPGSKGYQSLMMVANGDQNLMQMLQAGVVARASGTGQGFSAAMKSGDPNKMLDIMGVDQSSPVRANFRFQASQNKALAATERGLVGGYDASLRTSAAVTSGLSDLANALPPVTDALMTFKGALQTFPNAGNVGGTISGVASMATGLGSKYLEYRMLSKILGGGSGAIGLKGLVSKSKVGARGLLSKAGKFLPRLLKFGAAEAAIAGAEIFSGGANTPLLAEEEMAAGGLLGLGGPSGQGSSIGITTTPSPSPTAGYSSPVPTGTPVTSGYGPRNTHGNKNMSSNHKGIDYGVQQGTNITSVKAGVVKETGNGGGFGNYVLVKHADGTTSRYAHLSKILVSRGDKVSAGTIVGKSGGTPGTPGAGHSTGPHLHFEVKDKSGAHLNPSVVLSGAKPSQAKDPVSTGKVVSGAKTTHSANSSGQSSAPVALSQLSTPDINSVIANMQIGSSTSSNNLFGEGAAKNLGNNKSRSWVDGKLEDTPGVILATGSKRAWAVTFLKRLGKPTTDENVNAITTWMAWEGGHWHNSAHYNPLNTTQPEAGASNMNKTGVKSYKDWEQGYTASLSTINNGRYTNILKALSSGKSSSAVLTAVNRSPWGTNIPGYGGGSEGIGVSSVPAAAHGGTSGGSASLSTSSNINVTLKMDVKIASSSTADAERMVHYVGKRLKEEFGNGAFSVKSIASMG